MDQQRSATLAVRAFRLLISPRMSTLAEIEEVLPNLTAAELLQLEHSIREQIERQQDVRAHEETAGAWQPPRPRRLGMRALTAAQLRDLARGDEAVRGLPTA